MEEWVKLDFLGCSDYSVSNYGRIINNVTERFMRPSFNQIGFCKIGLMPSDGGLQVTLSVSMLVANAFLPEPPNERYDTPTNLDGDRGNNRADNLVWRPRWFAVKYRKQFKNDLRGFIVPIREINTREEFEISWDAAIKYGLIDRDIAIATANNTFVFPTGQQFEVIE